MGVAYEAGRLLSYSVLSLWAEAASRHTDHDADGIICDLGSGTGPFSAVLSARLRRPIVAIEPSRKMREQARASAPDVWIVAGNAEQIPLRPSSCHLVWMSQS